MAAFGSSLRGHSQPPSAPPSLASTGHGFPRSLPHAPQPVAPPTAVRMLGGASTPGRLPGGISAPNGIPKTDVSLQRGVSAGSLWPQSQQLGAFSPSQPPNGYPQQPQHRAVSSHRTAPREGIGRTASPGPPQFLPGDPSHYRNAHVQRLPDSPDKVTGPALASISQSLENAEEHRSLRQAQLASSIKSHLKHTGHTSSKNPNHSLSADSASRQWFENDPSGAGPVTLRSMHAAVQTLRQDPTAPLPAPFVGRVLADAEETLRRSRSAAVQHINLLSSTRLVVVGDTHGQLADVLWIFVKHGLPSRAVTYLFNGDIADRGSHALEIFVLVLGFLAAAPEIMHMNRGNHEDEAMNHAACGGFYDECLQKYDREIGGLLYDQMKRIYALLPIATVINQGVFVVHGGLSRSSHFLSKLESFHQRNSIVPPNPHDAREQALVDALWSDPSEKPGLTPSQRGSNLVHFGPDITQNFLRETGFSLVVRSHEVPPNLDGVYYMHGNRLMTVFSASNYCGSTGNQGAVLVFSEHNGKLSYDVSRHFAPALDSGSFSRLSEQTNGNALEIEQAANKEEVLAVQAAVARDPTNSRLHSDVLGQVARLVVEHKAALWAFFFRHDATKTGFVNFDVWVRGCQAIIGDYPWDQLEKLLAVADQGQVDYFGFLQRFRVALMGDEVSDNWADVFLSRVYQRLLQKDASFREFISIFDRNGDGVVTIQELQEAFTAMDVGITQQQAATLMRTISSHASSASKGGQPASSIDINSFLSRFEMVYHPLAEHRNLPAWVANAMKRIGRHLWAGDATENCAPQERARRFFEMADTSGDGRLSYQEFAVSLQRLIRHAGDSKLDLTEAQLADLAKWVDVNRQGTINYLEFLANFSTNDFVGGQAFQVDLMEHICTVIWCNKPALLVALLTIDVNHTGEVTREQLAAALRALNYSLDSGSDPLTDEQIQLLVDHTRFDSKTGKIRYQRFLNSFQVFDTAGSQ